LPGNRGVAGSAAGLTLLELLVALCIMALLLGVSLPDLRRTLAQKRADITMNRLAQAIQLARNAAALNNSLVTLCGSTDGEACDGNWRHAALIFLDRDGDRKVDAATSPDSNIVRWLMFPEIAGTLRWRAFGNRSYLQITPQGFTLYQNGNFTYCPANGDPSAARQLIVNRTARVRHARDSNGDGLREDSRGRPIRCP